MGLKNLFQPQAVAVIGASLDSKKIGRQILDNIISSKFTGAIYPINLKGGRIKGLKVLKDIAHIPLKDQSGLLVIIAIPAEFVPSELEKCGILGFKDIIIISAGFKEIGVHGLMLENKIKVIVDKYKLNVLGPNCLGLINNIYNINASFSKNSVGSGSIALLSQSGAIGSAALDWLMSRQLNFAYFISLGNKSYLNENDFLEYLAADKNITAIVLYLEEISDGQRLIALSSRLAKKKPLIILSSGLSRASQEIIKSHTGALAGSKESTIAALKRGGFLRVENLEELFLLLQIFSSVKNLQAKIKTLNHSEINIITNAGGLAALTADLASLEGIKIKNSFDILGDADPKRYQDAINRVAKQHPKTCILILLTPQAKTEPQKVAAAIAKINSNNKYPLLFTVFVGGEELREINTWLSQQKVAAFNFPEKAIKILKHLFTYKTIEHSVKQIQNSKTKVSSKAALVNLSSTTRMLDYVDSFKLLSKYKIKGVPTKRYLNEGANKEFKFPAVLKITGPDFLHKTDKKAIFLDLKSLVDLNHKVSWCQKKYHKLLKNDRNYLIYQEQVKGELELIIGLKHDRTFGSMLLVGLGGIYSEVFKQTAITIANLNKSEALSFIKELPFYEILNGVRGGNKFNLSKLADILVKLCQLAQDNPQIIELDINPLIVTKNEYIAVDVRVLVS